MYIIVTTELMYIVIKSIKTINFKWTETLNKINVWLTLRFKRDLLYSNCIVKSPKRLILSASHNGKENYELKKPNGILLVKSNPIPYK